MLISDEKKNKYILEVHKEMLRRGYTPTEIPIVIGKTGFMAVMEELPEEQMHYDFHDAVDDIMLTVSLFQENTNYNILTAANRELVDEFIDFLVARQEKNQKETQEAMREFEEGRSVGPINSVKDLMADVATDVTDSIIS